jgi:para-aminobenzoate synthetase component 1
MLTWAVPFNICCFLDSHSYGSSPATFECLLAAGAVEIFTATAGDAFSGLKEWSAGREDWLIGHFGFDLAKETEPIKGNTSFADPIGFPDLAFFVPEHLVLLQKDSIRIGSLGADPNVVWQQILGTPPAVARPAAAPPSFTPRFTREEYLSTVGALRRHILRGDCYEINFCQEFFDEAADIDPYSTWWALSQASPNPFAAFYRVGERFLLCSSPERFLKRAGDTLYSQPIKGTAPRHLQDGAADLLQRERLYRSGKDRAENVMVVDLVRNDLARVCRPGTVRVAELFGIYPFPQVYQMISTVVGEMLPGLDWTDAIRACFPMGSMTGAPKNRVVQLIAQYERSRRGLFSGAVGYRSPTGDFDFNVVIRSLLYNRADRYLSYQVGSGITFYSDPEAEYAECLVKAEGIRKALHL